MPQVNELKRGKDIGRASSGLIKFIWHACEGCGKLRWVQYALKKESPVSKFCRDCAVHSEERNKKISEAASGRRHYRWQGGRMKTKQGYIKIWLPKDDFFYQMVDTSGYVREHRLVMARSLGRNLHSWELVHHKGTKYPKGSIENKQDNRLENLQLVSDDRHTQISILERKIQHLEKQNLELKERVSKIIKREKELAGVL